jgi:hypothetical protein
MILSTIVQNEDEMHRLNKKLGNILYIPKHCDEEDYPLVIYYALEDGGAYAGWDFLDSACLYSDPESYKLKQINLNIENITDGGLV